MGNAKLLLVYKVGVDKEPLARLSQKTSDKTFTDPAISIATESIKESTKKPLIKSARELSTLTLLEIFDLNYSEPAVESIPIAAIDSTLTSSENPTQITSEGLLKESLTESLQKSSITPVIEPTADLSPKFSTLDSMEPSAVFSQILSADIIKKLEAKLTLPELIPPIKNVEPAISRNNLSFQSNELAYQAELRLQSNVTYDGRYLRMAYPMGDVPENIGVCTDVVIRSLRGLGIDLQQRVHEDMKRNFRSYPNKWQLTRPDSNIDHRRVPNLMTFFKRAGAALRITSNPLDYRAGEIVAWEMGNGMTHIGIVSTHVSEKTGNPLIVHNIGIGPELTDILFDFKIIGHYKYGGNQYKYAKAF